MLCYKSGTLHCAPSAKPKMSWPLIFTSALTLSTLLHGNHSKSSAWMTGSCMPIQPLLSTTAWPNDANLPLQLMQTLSASIMKPRLRMQLAYSVSWSATLPLSRLQPFTTLAANFPPIMDISPMPSNPAIHTLYLDYLQPTCSSRIFSYYYYLAFTSSYQVLIAWYCNCVRKYNQRSLDYVIKCWKSKNSLILDKYISKP